MSSIKSLVRFLYQSVGLGLVVAAIIFLIQPYIQNGGPSQFNLNKNDEVASFNQAIKGQGTFDLIETRVSVWNTNMRNAKIAATVRHPCMKPRSAGTANMAACARFGSVNIASTTAPVESR